MARGRVKIQRIVNEQKRKTTFKRRLAGFIKKMREFTILCDVPACLVVYDGPDQTRPVVWPSPAEAADLMQRFREMPNSDKTKKKMNSESLLRKEVEKLKGKVYGLEQGNCDRETNLIIKDLLIHRRQSIIDHLRPDVLASVGWKVEKLLRDVHASLATRHALAPPEQAVPVAPPPSKKEVLMVAPPAVAPPAVPQAPIVVLPPPKKEVLMVNPPVVVPPSVLQAPIVALLRPKNEVLMVAPPAVTPPAVPQAPILAPHATAAAPMALYGVPHHGSYHYEVYACNIAGSGSRVPTTGEMYDIFIKAEINPGP